MDLWNPEYQHGMDELSKEIGFNLEQGCDGFCAYIRNENPKYCDICSAGICFKQVNELVADINQYHNAELALAIMDSDGPSFGRFDCLSHNSVSSAVYKASELLEVKPFALL